MARPGSWLRSPAATVLLAADNGDRGTVGAPAPAQKTLSRQRRTGSCSQMMIYPASSRSAPGAVAQSILHFDYICNVTVAIQPRCRGVQCKCWSAVLTHPSQLSPARLGSALHKSLALNFSEWNLLIRWDYRHYSQSSPPAAGHRAQPGVDYTKKLFDNGQ